MLTLIHTYPTNTYKLLFNVTSAANLECSWLLCYRLCDQCKLFFDYSFYVLFIYRHAKHGFVFDLATVVKPMFSVRIGLIVQATDI